MPHKIAIEKSKIGFIGAGNMAQSMAKAIIKSGQVKNCNVYVSAPSNQNLPTFISMGCTTTHNNMDLLDGDRFDCNIIFLCVKPNIIAHYLRQNKPFITCPRNKELIVISVMAGICLRDIEKAVVGPEALHCYRIMTNTACSVGEGVTAITCDANKCPIECNDLVKSLLSCFGICEFLPEYQMNSVVGVAGSGIAFVRSSSSDKSVSLSAMKREPIDAKLNPCSFYSRKGYTFIQAMADAAVKMGLPRNLAITFAAQTLSGASKMVLTSGKHPIELRDSVCSPGGTTICGVHALEKAAVSSGIMDAVEVATKRAEELSAGK